jgi:hypothetical protein
MRSFSSFDAHLTADDVDAADAAHIESLAMWAYLLLRPGLEFVRQRSNFILGWQAAAAQGASVTEGVSAGAVGHEGVPALGSWMILPDLTSPATRTVLPSNDALYGAAQVELDMLGPVVISVPANLDDRYYSVAVMDAHMNNVAHIGPRWTGNEAGDFLLVPPGWQGVAPDGMPVIASSTLSTVLYNRMIVEYDSGDLDRVRQWQAGLRITRLSLWGGDTSGPADVQVDPFVHPDINTMTRASEYLRIGLDHMRRNPMAAGAEWLADMVDAGLGDASVRARWESAIEKGVDAGTALIDATLTTWPRHAGWMVPDPALGLPNPQVVTSAAFQQFMIGANDVSESTYYFTDTDAAGDLLDGSANARYVLRFPGSALPPHHPGGYWSLTMYDENSHLVTNDIGRYSTRITRPGFVRDADGGATITMSAVLPHGLPEANWLPAPEGPFRLGLRVYYPGTAAIEGDWLPSGVERQSA